MKLSHPIYVPSCLRHSAPNLDPEAKMSCAVITDSLSRKCVFVCVCPSWWGCRNLLAAGSIQHFPLASFERERQRKKDRERKTERGREREMWTSCFCYSLTITTSRLVPGAHGGIYPRHVAGARGSAVQWHTVPGFLSPLSCSLSPSCLFFAVKDEMLCQLTFFFTAAATWTDQWSYDVCIGESHLSPCSSVCVCLVSCRL